MSDKRPPARTQAPFNNYDLAAASDQSALYSDEPSLTVQADLEDSDINTIVRRFGLTGEMPSDVRVPTYQDFEDVFDFQSAQNVILEAGAEFLRMPAHVRARFQNDPQAFLEFASDARNLREMVSLGLAVARPEELVEPVVKPPGAVPRPE